MEPCQEWAGAKTSNGYGSRWSPVHVVKSAHVVAFEAVHGVVPPGYVVHHLCENKLCVRLDHLQLLSWAEHNALHSSNAKKTECPRGHPYDEANTRVSHGRRQCRACDNERSRRRKRGSDAEAHSAV
jgi:hypothetical protein